MSGVEGLAVAGVVVAVLAAAVLAAVEAALTRLSTARAEALVEERHRGANSLRALVDRRDEVLLPVLLVKLGTQLGVATTVAILVRWWWGGGAVLPATLIVVAVLFLFTEAIPKAIALSHVDAVALRLAPVARVLWWTLPLRWVGLGLARFVRDRSEPESRSTGGSVSEEELLALAEEAAAAAAIDLHEHELIESIIEFGDTIAREVMVPRPDMVVVPQDFRVVDAIEVVILNGYSRVPVAGESIDDIVGVVHAKDLMRADRDGRGEDPVSAVMRPVRAIPETKRVAPLLREMQAEHFHLAILIDEYGGTAGLVTLEDLLEEVVGEIVDEFDVEPPLVEALGDGQYRVNGRVPRYDIEELLDTELPDGDWNTVGGLIFSTLGHVPRVGESVDVDGHRFLVERVQGRRIARVRVSPLNDERPEPESDDCTDPLAAEVAESSSP